MNERHPGNCLYLDWDSQFFGFPIGKISGPLFPAKISRIRRWCKKHKIKCLYYLCPSEDPASIQAAGDFGFRSVDIRCHYKIRIKGKARTRPRRLKGIMTPSPRDLPTLQNLAATAFKKSRFNADPHFGKKRAADLYRIWIKKSCEGWAHQVWAARRQGKIAGFITCHLEARRTGRIGLFAVRKEFRRQGIGSQLMTAAINYFAQKGMREVQAATQGCNLESQGLFAKSGLRLAAMHLWFHKWF